MPRQAFGSLQPTFPDEPEGIMMGAPGASTSTLTVKGKPKSVKKTKKYSETENRLMHRYKEFLAFPTF